MIAVFSGLPGTGKTCLAEATGRSYSLPVFSVAWILGALAPFGILEFEDRRDVAYEMLTMLIRRQLDLGQSGIVDGMCGEEVRRRQWRQLAESRGARFVAIECVCTDRNLHRRRIEQRHDAISGWPDPGWSHVREMEQHYEPWTSERLVVDALEPVVENFDSVRRYIDRIVRPVRGASPHGLRASHHER